jgi:putative OPT family oligopeptide transporter
VLTTRPDKELDELGIRCYKECRTPMASPTTDPSSRRNAAEPFVPENSRVREFSFRAVFLGLFLTLLLGVMNVYLGLRAGIIIAAAYPAAVLSITMLRLGRASILEENLARSGGSIGTAVAAGAIFTVPAFFVANAWSAFAFNFTFPRIVALVGLGAVFGVLFGSLLRRALVHDKSLSFPESNAASEIHKVSVDGGTQSTYFFYNLFPGAIVFLLGALKLFATDNQIPLSIGKTGAGLIRFSPTVTLAAGGRSIVPAPSVSPALLGVGYVIGLQPTLLMFSGSLFSWGVLVPLVIFLLGPRLASIVATDSGDVAWGLIAHSVWNTIVKPIAVGMMVVGAAAALFGMRASLRAALHATAVLLRRGSKLGFEATRADKELDPRLVLFGTLVTAAALYSYSFSTSGSILIALLVVLIVVGFGFLLSCVAGRLVGEIGFSNTPISGLTIAALMIAGLSLSLLHPAPNIRLSILLSLSVCVCVACSVAGGMMQDLKVTHQLGGTPRYIQIVELLGALCMSCVVSVPLLLLYKEDIQRGGTGFGSAQLPSPQASLIGNLAQGLVGGELAWPLVSIGILLGILLLTLRVSNVMLVAVGMYLPIPTTATVLIGGFVNWLVTRKIKTANWTDTLKDRATQVGILTASGFIAGETLAGLARALIVFARGKMPEFLSHPSYSVGLAVLALLGTMLRILPVWEGDRMKSSTGN